jgi:hypothetical protein
LRDNEKEDEERETTRMDWNFTYVKHVIIAFVLCGIFFSFDFFGLSLCSVYPSLSYVTHDACPSRVVDTHLSMVVMVM